MITGLLSAPATDTAPVTDTASGTATATRTAPVARGTSAAPARYTRRISPTERGYLMAHMMALPMAIQIFVEGAGGIDPDQLTSAVELASAACPGARVIRRGPNWVDGGRTPPVTVVDAADLDRTTYDHPLLHRPIDPAAGPNCEVLLLTGQPATVVFRVSHAVMDGKGAMTWITDVFRVLRGEEPLGAPATDTEEDFVARFAPAAAGGGQPAATETRFGSPIDAFEAADLSTETDPRPDAPGWIWRRRTVPGVHPALAARIAAALTEALGGPTRFVVPASLRRHDPSVASTANLTLPITLDLEPGTPWRTTQGRLVQAVMQGRELTAEGERAGNFKLAALAAIAPSGAAGRAVGGEREAYRCTAILSDLGRLDPAQLSGGGFTAATAYSLPMYVPYAPAFFTLYQLPAHAEIAVSCRNAPGAGARAEALLAALEAALA